jgi:hypothetical protein
MLLKTRERNLARIYTWSTTADSHKGYLSLYIMNTFTDAVASMLFFCQKENVSLTIYVLSIRRTCLF